METLHHYFNRVEDETIKAKLFANTPLNGLSMTASSLEMSVYHAFPWEDSPEGVEYWHKVANSFAVKRKAKPGRKKGTSKKKTA